MEYRNGLNLQLNELIFTWSIQLIPVALTPLHIFIESLDVYTQAALYAVKISSAILVMPVIEIRFSFPLIEYMLVMSCKNQLQYHNRMERKRETVVRAALPDVSRLFACALGSFAKLSNICHEKIWTRKPDMERFCSSVNPRPSPANSIPIERSPELYTYLQTYWSITLKIPFFKTCKQYQNCVLDQSRHQLVRW